MLVYTRWLSHVGADKMAPVMWVQTRWHLSCGCRQDGTRHVGADKMAPVMWVQTRWHPSCEYRQDGPSSECRQDGPITWAHTRCPPLRGCRQDGLVMWVQTRWIHHVIAEPRRRLKKGLSPMSSEVTFLALMKPLNFT
ncbi:hypothetical protein BgiMline_008884 [Biomphalaria glabrata]|nr:hypothetical protein BgiMline_027462 [Biomphalaria glabrata]